LDESLNIDIYSDIVCPWCFIGKKHLDRALPLLLDDGLKPAVAWRPFQLNPDMPPQGVERTVYRTGKFGSAARGEELDEHVAQAGRVVGIQFRHDLMQRTPNTLQGHRLLALAARHRVQDAVADRLFSAYFCEGEDIGDDAVLVRQAARCGLEPGRVRTFLDGDDDRADILSQDAAVRRAGLSGVPTFALDGHIVFSGAVPADTMAEGIAKAWRVLQARKAYSNPI